MEIRSTTEIHNFRRAPVVDVTIAEVANTLVQWLRWMAGSYVGHLDTKTASSRSACLKYLGLATPQYIDGPANLVGHPECMTFQGRCALASPARLLWTPRILRGNEGFLVGCTPSGPAKYLRMLGRLCFETFLRSVKSILAP
jgi:hypothetical protein